MVRLRAIHKISIIVMVAVFLASTLLVSLANYSIPAAALFSFMNIIGATFPPNLMLLDQNSPFVLASIVLAAIGSLAFTITFTTLFYELLRSIDIRYAFAKRRARSLSGHVVITPINEMGIGLAKKLVENKIAYVFVDDNMQGVRRALRNGFLALHGDPTKEEALAEARVSRAIAVCTLHEEDTKNAFIAIEVRRAEGQRRIGVISRIKKPEDIPKMERAGLRKIILPEAAVGVEMGDFLVRNS